MIQLSAGQDVRLVGIVNARYDDGSVMIRLRDGQSVLTSRCNLEPAPEPVVAQRIDAPETVAAARVTRKRGPSRPRAKKK